MGRRCGGHAEHDGDGLEEARDHNWILLVGREGGKRVLVALITAFVIAAVAACGSVGTNLVLRVSFMDILTSAH